MAWFFSSAGGLIFFKHWPTFFLTFAREFGASAHKRLAELADVCGIGGKNDAEKANAFIRWIEETNEKMGLPNKFDMVKDEDIDQMITWAKKEANPLYPVPTIWGRKDFRRLIESIRK